MRTYEGSGNHVVFIEDDGSETRQPLINGAIEGIKIDISGENNQVRISRRQQFVGCDLNIFGNHNVLEIGLSKNPIFHSLFHFAPLGHHRRVRIGSGFSGGGHFRVVEDGNFIEIGERCLFSWEILIMASDYHAIYDETGKVINQSKGVTLGDDVWVGCRSTILKDTKIPNGCIVGAGSVITKRFETEQCILAGNPASIIKEKVKWSYDGPHEASINSPFQVGVNGKARPKGSKLSNLLHRIARS